MNLALSLADVKVFVDRNGQVREVLMSYETFRQIETALQELIGKDDQGYFWTETWQQRIREAELDIQAGRTRQLTKETVASVLEWLDE